MIEKAGPVISPNGTRLPDPELEIHAFVQDTDLCWT